MCWNNIIMNIDILQVILIKTSGFCCSNIDIPMNVCIILVQLKNIFSNKQCRGQFFRKTWPILLMDISWHLSSKDDSPIKYFSWIVSVNSWVYKLLFTLILVTIACLNCLYDSPVRNSNVLKKQFLSGLQCFFVNPRLSIILEVFPLNSSLFSLFSICWDVFYMWFQSIYVQIGNFQLWIRIFKAWLIKKPLKKYVWLVLQSFYFFFYSTVCPDKTFSKISEK